MRIRADNDEELHVTWDTTDASVRLRYARSGGVHLDLYRESATRIVVEQSTGVRTLIVEYGSAESPCWTCVQVTPTVSIEDDFLRG